MLPNTERETSHCGHAVTALSPYAGSRWCSGTAHQQKYGGFFLEYSQVVLQLNPALGALAEPLRHWWDSPGARPRRCRQDWGLQS